MFYVAWNYFLIESWTYLTSWNWACDEPRNLHRKPRFTVWRFMHSEQADQNMTEMSNSHQNRMINFDSKKFLKVNPENVLDIAFGWCRQSLGLQSWLQSWWQSWLQSFVDNIDGAVEILCISYAKCYYFRQLRLDKSIRGYLQKLKNIKSSELSKYFALLN